MNFFGLNDENEIELNKDFVLLNPIYEKIYKRDKGSKGDTQARKKLMAQRDFKLLYFMWNPNSDYAEYVNEDERLEKVLELLDIDKNDFESDDDLTKAFRYYEGLIKNLPSFKIMNASFRGFQKMIDFIENIDFEDVDKQGKLKYTPKDFAQDIAKMTETRTNLEELRKQIIEEYTESLTPRGSTVLGGREMRKRDKWEEKY